MACSGGTSYSSPPDAGGLDGAGFDASGEPPPNAACDADAATSCLSGTAKMMPGFSASPKRRIASLFEVFPPGAAPIASQLVAKDDTWAFSGLLPWAHYYVRIVGEFVPTSDGGLSVAALVGPMAVPSNGAGKDVLLKPVQLELLEQKATGGAMQIVSVRAHVFDPASGAEVTADGATVSITLAGTETPVPWVQSEGAYFVQFATPPPAQASYVVTTTIAGSSPTVWTLIADPPTFDGVITSPGAGATVPHDQNVSVTWPEQPAADFEVPQLYAQSDAGWAIDYPAGPQPIAPEAPPWDGSAPQWTIPATAGDAAVLAPGGTYLLDLSFTRASCPVSADGCVLSAAVAAVQFTAN